MPASYRIVAAAGLAGLLASAAGGMPAGPATVEIVVTSRSDAMNADVSSAAGLLASPGPDGVSLREALEATNNDPGEHAIRFAPGLRGKSIRVGSRAGEELPELSGGGVDLDGDVNRDGRPDVTIANGAARDRCNTNGLTIASGGNRIHGLVLSGFGIGVRLAPPFQRGALPRGRTFADIEVSGLVIDACAIGTWLAPTGYRNCERRACATGNRWTDIRITGNRIATRTSGIEFQLGGTKDELLDRVTISGNTVHIRASGRAADTLWGVNLVAGAEAGTNNRIANVVIRGNTVTGNPGGGVRAAAGDNGPDANVVERIRIVGNTVRIGPPESVPRRGGVTRVGVWLTAGDGSRPGEYPERNVVRDVEVRGNKLSEGMGVVAFAACCGASANMITDLRIIGNSIRTLGSRRGIQLTAGHWEEGQPTKANRVHRVTVSRNRIVVGSAGVGVFVGGGSGRLAHGNRVTCVRLSGNRVTGTARPVAVVDNFVEPGGGGPATRNSASLTGC